MNKNNHRMYLQLYTHNFRMDVFLFIYIKYCMKEITSEFIVQNFMVQDPVTLFAFYILFILKHVVVVSVSKKVFNFLLALQKAEMKMWYDWDTFFFHWFDVILNFLRNSLCFVLLIIFKNYTLLSARCHNYSYCFTKIPLYDFP